MAAIELVVTDLDGTLWDADERIHARTLEALHQLDGRRVPLLVATGRRLRSAADCLARSDLRPPSVVLDGSMGRDLTDGRTFHEVSFAPDDAAHVLAIFAESGLQPCVYVDRPDAEVVVGDAPSTHPAHLAYIGKWLGRAELCGVVTRERVFAFGLTGRDAGPLHAVAARLAAHASASVTRDLVLGGFTLMVKPFGVTKWQGVLAFCADQGLDAGKVLAVGDGANDLELLEGARIACVVSDGCEEALALADYVIEPAGDGGWSKILGWV